MLDKSKALLVFSFATLTAFAAAQAQGTGSSSAGNPPLSQSASANSSGKPVKSGVSVSDKRFMKKAAEGGLAEVELGQLATQKASSDDVKKFGQRMVDDHGKANDQLKQLASQKNVQLPQEPNAKDKATKTRLEKLSGSEFDKAYMSEMRSDHKKDVAEFEHESKMAKDSDVKNFASQTLSTLQDHLKQAESVAPSPKSESSALQKPKNMQK